MPKDKCPRCGLMREPGDHELPESCIRALKGALRAERQRCFMEAERLTGDSLLMWAIRNPSSEELVHAEG